VWQEHRNFFKLFSEYRGRPFWVSLIEMRRYGNGIYVPVAHQAAGGAALSETLLTALARWPTPGITTLAHNEGNPARRLRRKGADAGITCTDLSVWDSLG